MLPAAVEGGLQGAPVSLAVVGSIDAHEPTPMTRIEPTPPEMSISARAAVMTNSWARRSRPAGRR